SPIAGRGWRCQSFCPLSRTKWRAMVVRTGGKIMQSSFIRSAAVAAIVLPVAASCAHFPASPVPAALTEREADTLARNRLYEREGGAPRLMSSITRTGEGYLIAYHGDFNAAGKPPRETRMV